MGIAFVRKEDNVNKLNLQAKARELAQRASASNSGRAADTITGGHEKRLRQTVVALREGTEMDVREGPDEATLLVISGRLWLAAGETRWSAQEWGYLVVPDEPYSIKAETDTTFMLTVALRG